MSQSVSRLFLCFVGWSDFLWVVITSRRDDMRALWLFWVLTGKCRSSNWLRFGNDLLQVDLRIHFELTRFKKVSAKVHKPFTRKLFTCTRRTIRMMVSNRFETSNDPVDNGFLFFFTGNNPSTRRMSLLTTIFFSFYRNLSLTVLHLSISIEDTSLTVSWECSVCWEQKSKFICNFPTPITCFSTNLLPREYVVTACLPGCSLTELKQQHAVSSTWRHYGVAMKEVFCLRLLKEPELEPELLVNP